MSGLDERLAWLPDALAWTSGVAAEAASAHPGVPALLVAVGLVTLALGARARRPLAALGAGLLAAASAGLASGTLEPLTGLEPRTLGGLAALAGAAAGVALPAAFPALAGALPGALAGAGLAPEPQRLLAVGVGALAGAVLGLLLARPVAAVAAAALGAGVLALGVAGGAAALGAGRALVTHPAALLGLAGILAVAGFAWQLPTAWSPPARPSRPPGEADRAADGEA
jgi:hypothetical protein